jgi:hypothetical protein
MSLVVLLGPSIRMCFSLRMFMVRFPDSNTPMHWMRVSNLSLKTMPRLNWILSSSSSTFLLNSVLEPDTVAQGLSSSKAK